VTNAWLKCYELLSKYQISGDVLHFDNAAMPGSFILAAHHYYTTQDIKYDWYASSLIDEKQPHLGDYYGLYKKYPEKWLMTNNNGDVSNFDNIELIARNLLDKTAGRKPNLFTSDLGFDVAEKYNNQEILHMRANVGQIMLCLKTLAQGGNCVIKHYTFFEDFTLAYLMVFGRLFKKFYIYKPYTSKSLNSEVYIVGLAYTPNNGVLSGLQKLLSDPKAKLWDEAELAQFKTNIYKKVDQLFYKQIKRLEVAVTCAQHLDKTPGANPKEYILQSSHGHSKNAQTMFYRMCKLVKIDSDKKMV
jgi:hypothetical protein